MNATAGCVSRAAIRDFPADRNQGPRPSSVLEENYSVEMGRDENKRGVWVIPETARKQLPNQSGGDYFWQGCACDRPCTP
jgi:hypothetical protein